MLELEAGNVTGLVLAGEAEVSLDDMACRPLGTGSNLATCFHRFVKLCAVSYVSINLNLFQLNNT